MLQPGFTVVLLGRATTASEETQCILDRRRSNSRPRCGRSCPLNCVSRRRPSGTISSKVLPAYRPIDPPHIDGSASEVGGSGDSTAKGCDHATHVTPTIGQ